MASHGCRGTGDHGGGSPARRAAGPDGALQPLDPAETLDVRSAATLSSDASVDSLLCGLARSAAFHPLGAAWHAQGLVTSPFAQAMCWPWLRDATELYIDLFDTTLCAAASDPNMQRIHC